MAMNVWERRLQQRQGENFHTKKPHASRVVFEYGEGTVYPSDAVPSDWNKFVEYAGESEVIKDSIVQDKHGPRSRLEFRASDISKRHDPNTVNAAHEDHIGNPRRWYQGDNEKFSISTRGKYQFYRGVKESLDPGHNYQYLWCHMLVCKKDEPGAENHWARHKKDIWVRWEICTHKGKHDECKIRDTRHEKRQIQVEVKEDDIELDGYTQLPNGWWQLMISQSEVFQIV